MWNLEIWETRYKRSGEKTPGDTMVRVASALAKGVWETHFRQFLRILETGEFVPGGRVLANAGTSRGMLLNCFNVPIEDSRHGIFRALSDGVEVLAHGGGVGFNFSNLRAAGSELRTTGGVSQGPVPFIDLFDQSFNLISRSYVKRQAAAIAVLSSDHPDVIDFINAKKNNGEGSKRWTSMNVSVDFTNSFINEVSNKDEARDSTIAAWEAVVESTHACGDPGFVFLHRARADANQIEAPITGVNPCGEVPLPDYGACCLGSINLSAFVAGGKIDYTRLNEVVPVAVDMLTSVLFASEYPGEEFRYMAHKYRRIGLGVTGLAHALIKCGYVYGTAEANNWTAEVMNTIAVKAYRKSIEMAKDASGSVFEPVPLRTDGLGFFCKTWLAPHIPEVMDTGLFHSGLMAIAPTGSTSMLVKTSPGIEPIFSVETVRVDRGVRRVVKDSLVDDYPTELFRTALEVTPKEHLLTLATIQKYVDGSVSKTINLPEGTTKEEFDSFSQSVLLSEVKGLTVYRDKSLGDQVVSLDEPITDAKIYQVSTPAGKVYIPVGRDSKGKADPERIIRTLSAIKSGEPKWIVFRGRQIPILSVPDAVAHVLADSVGVGISSTSIDSAASATVPFSTVDPSAQSMCPECGGVLINKEGCTSCSICSFGYCGG
jgi:ribonucleoside-diphosphate reductase alpha chain